MRGLPWIAVVVLGLAPAVAGQEGAPPGPDVRRASFEEAFPRGGSLRVKVRSGDVRILGSDDDRIAIRYEGKKAGLSHEVKVQLERTSSSSADLSIKGGPHNEFRIILTVPRTSSLRVRMPFGDLEVSQVMGDLDVELHAGDLTVHAGDAGRYAHVDASVSAGDLSADPFGVQKGGLFRSFKKDGPGTHRLHAHVGSGDLTLEN